VEIVDRVQVVLVCREVILRVQDHRDRTIMEIMEVLAIRVQMIKILEPKGLIHKAPMLKMTAPKDQIRKEALLEIQAVLRDQTIKAQTLKIKTLKEAPLRA